MADVKLPAVWMQSFLGEIAEDISYGYTAASTTEEIGPRMLRITDIQDNSVDWDSVPFCKIDSHRELKYLLSEGDLVFARTGATVGKSYLIKGNVPSAVYASYLIRVRCSKEIYISYLSHFFNAPTYWGQITEFSSGIGQPNVNGTKLKGLLIPIPSLAEQKVIAEKLDTLLAQVDSAKARLEQIPQILKRFRQSVLAAAVSGKLTEEWRQEKNIKKWQLKRLKELCNSISDGDHQAPPKSESGIPFLVISNVNNGIVNFNNVSRWVPEEYYNSLKDFRKPQKNDILYTVTGSFGIPVIVDTEREFCFQRHIAIIKPNHDIVDFRYLAFYLQSPNMFKFADEVATGTAQKTVSLSNLRMFEIHTPSIEEQTEIVRRVEQLFAYADTIEKQVQDALLRVNNLTQSILAKAFRGELTEQWRAENPDLISGENSAEALLAKIKAERETVKPKKKSAK